MDAEARGVEPRRAGEDCGRFDRRPVALRPGVLTRTQEEWISALDFEFARAACVEIYAVLMGCGLE
jgi:hypothetical protein